MKYLMTEERHFDYHLLFENGDDSFILWEYVPSKDTYVVAEVNETACQRYGYSHEEFIGLTPAQLNTVESIRNSKPLADHLNKYGHTSGEITHITKDGTLIPTEVRAHRFLHNGRIVIFSICRDITERKNTEQSNVEIMIQALITEKTSRLLTKIDSATSLIKDKYGDFSFSTSLKEVCYHGKKIHVTPTESLILRMLVLKKGHVLTYKELSQTLSSKNNAHQNGKNIRVYIHNLREKFKGCTSSLDLIQTRMGKGYYIPIGYT